MTVSDNTLLIDEYNGRPRPNIEPLPNGEIVVLHHRELDSEPFGRVFDIVERFLPRKFWRMYPDDGEAGFFVFIMPSAQLRDDIAAVDSAIGPKFDQDNPAAQPFDAERFAIDPVLASYFRRWFLQGDGRTCDRAPGPAESNGR